MVTVLIPIDSGFEEMEVVDIADLLRMAGADVTIASLHPKTGDKWVQGARKMKLEADAFFEDVASKEWDVIFIPGGEENSKLQGKNKVLVDRLRQQRDSGKWLTAICHAPKVVLDDNGLLDGFKGTCFPELQLKDNSCAEQRVVVDRNVITSRAPGTCADFAFAVIENCIGKGKSAPLIQKMLFNVECCAKDCHKPCGTKPCDKPCDQPCDKPCAASQKCAGKTAESK